MTFTSLTTALALYRSRTLSLEQAANYGGVQTSKLASELRSRGIRVRDEGRDALPGQALN